ASAAARIARVEVYLMNAWISRGLIPGVKVGTRGRARLFDLDAVVHVAIMGALVRLRYGGSFASRAAFQAREWWQRPGAKLIIGPPLDLPSGRLGFDQMVTL